MFRNCEEHFQTGQVALVTKTSVLFWFVETVLIRSKVLMSDIKINTDGNFSGITSEASETSAPLWRSAGPGSWLQVSFLNFWTWTQHCCNPLCSWRSQSRRTEPWWLKPEKQESVRTHLYGFFNKSVILSQINKSYFLLKHPRSAKKILRSRLWTFI